MKRIKQCWQIFVLCFVCVLAATLFISCDTGANASVPGDTQEPAVGDTATTEPDDPTPPAPETPENPDNPIVPPHQHDQHEYGEWYVAIEETCTQPRVERRDCTAEDCDDYETRETTIQLSHHEITTTITQATCTTPGYEKHSCAWCDYSYTEEIPALGHDYQPTVAHTYQCTRCDSSYVDDPMDNLVGTYWYHDGGKFAIYFKSANEYCSYKCQSGTLLLDEDYNYIEHTYNGTYIINRNTDTGLITIDLIDAYLHSENSAYEVSLTYYTDEDETTGNVVYKLEGEFIKQLTKVWTLIFAGYDL